MSFLDKFKNLGKADAEAPRDGLEAASAASAGSPFGSLPSPYDDALDSGSRPQSSIISEAVPTTKLPTDMLPRCSPFGGWRGSFRVRAGAYAARTGWRVLRNQNAIFQRLRRGAA